MSYVQPKSLDEALKLLSDEPWVVLSGGTDFYPASLERPVTSSILDIHGLDEFRGIQRDGSQIRIGANVTWSELLEADLPPAFDGLKLAAREVGSVQIQNRATLVGNICNASPAADGVPPLQTLNAQVELMSARTRRCIPLEKFILGNRDTALEPDELVSAIVIPSSAFLGVSTFKKLGSRKYLVISISMVAARLIVDEHNQITDAAVSVGSCSLVAQRLQDLEKLLIGQSRGKHLIKLVTSEHLSGLAPIDDVRSTVSYRRECSLELVRRSLAALCGDDELSSNSH